jgi:N-acetylneuraminic acid mutarotase
MTSRHARINGKIYASPAGSGTDVDVYDPVADTWNTVSTLPGGDRETMVFVAGSDGLLYVLGGNFATPTAEVDAYNPTTNAWAQRSPMPAPRAELGGALGPDGRIFIFGGQSTFGGSELTAIAAFDPGTDTWYQ